MEWAFVKTLFSLFLVLGAMFGVLYLLKKFVIGGKVNNGSLVDVELLGKRMIQPKNYIAVVKTVGKIIVIGISDHGMQLLTEISEDEYNGKYLPGLSLSNYQKSNGEESFGKRFQDAFADNINKYFKSFSLHGGKSGNGKNGSSHNGNGVR